MFATWVYLLCFLTSGACAWLLLRSYRRAGEPLLLWSGVSFVIFAANNLALVLDLLVFDAIDLRLLRGLLALAAVSVLLFGFIWHVEER